MDIQLIGTDLQAIRFRRGRAIESRHAHGTEPDGRNIVITDLASGERWHVFGYGGGLGFKQAQKSHESSVDGERLELTSYNPYLYCLKS